MLQIVLWKHIPIIPVMFCFHDALFLYLRTVIAIIIIPDKALAEELWAKYRLHRAQINAAVKQADFRSCETLKGISVLRPTVDASSLSIPPPSMTL